MNAIAIVFENIQMAGLRKSHQHQAFSGQLEEVLKPT